MEGGGHQQSNQETTRETMAATQQGPGLSLVLITSSLERIEEMISVGKQFLSNATHLVQLSLLSSEIGTREKKKTFPPLQHMD